MQEVARCNEFEPAEDDHVDRMGCGLSCERETGIGRWRMMKSSMLKAERGRRCTDG